MTALCKKKRLSYPDSLFFFEGVNELSFIHFNYKSYSVVSIYACIKTNIA